MGNEVGCADCDGIMRIGSGCDCGCSVFSDSAIFLLRSMQRDECLIPIRASKNVHSHLTEVKRENVCLAIISPLSPLTLDNFHLHPKLRSSLEIPILLKDTKLHEVPKALRPLSPQCVVDSMA